jgi:hypothetical protein
MNEVRSKNYELGTSDQSEFTIENSIFSRFRLLPERALAARAKRAYTDRCAQLGKRFATVWSGWGSNLPRNSFRFCRAKLVIGLNTGHGVTRS